MPLTRIHPTISHARSFYRSALARYFASRTRLTPASAARPSPARSLKFMPRWSRPLDAVLDALVMTQQNIFVFTD
jgi:hypothetical protein